MDLWCYFHSSQNISKNIIQYIVKNNGSPEIKASKSSGLGFSFIKTRLEEAFPQKWKLSYGPASDGGWEVIIEINLETNEKNTDAEI